jgi:hypothetical protein
MRYLLLLFLFTQPISTYSQFFVGDSKKFAKSVLKREKIKFTEDKITDTTGRISWIFENEYQMILVLNTDEIVIRQTLIPEKENGVNEFVKWFNKDFVIISDTEWKNYSNGRIYKIHLEYILGEPFFSITLSPSSK